MSIILALLLLIPMKHLDLPITERQKGVATWYATESIRGSKPPDNYCAVGEYRHYHSKRQYIKVTGNNGVSFICRVMDHCGRCNSDGWRKRVIDLSPYLFKQLAPLHIGVFRVTLEPLWYSGGSR
jgi:rare lipoprotein A (peptidoglycan hydrolase)